MNEIGEPTIYKGRDAIKTTKAAFKFIPFWPVRFWLWLTGMPENTSVAVSRSYQGGNPIMLTMGEFREKNTDKIIIYWATNMSIQAARKIGSDLVKLADQMELAKNEN